jgi:hypothetical protein
LKLREEISFSNSRREVVYCNVSLRHWRRSERGWN